MNKFEIGIIGGTSGMGKWFANFFEREGYTVHSSGLNIGMDITKMAEICTIVIVSVPINVTREVIKHIGPHMREKTLLMDLTSLKEKPVESMLQHSVSDVIGLHPLFGPNVSSISGHNIVVCPARGKKWLTWITEILEKNGALVLETLPERHDEMMALIQGLTHLNTIMMGMTLADTGEKLSELENYSTPIFNTNLENIKKVFTENPRLYADIISLNPHIHKIIGMYEKNLNILKKLIEKRNAEELTELIEKQVLFK